MTKERKSSPLASKKSLTKVFSDRIRARLAKKKSEDFRKLLPAELERLGYSPKSERFVERSARRIAAKTPTLSKRQYEQKRLGVTLEQRAKEYLAGDRTAATAAQASMRERSLQSWALRKRYPGESVARIREHLRNIELKERGDYLADDVWLREKAFSESHNDVPEEYGFYQKWFNYGHVKRAA